MGCPVELDREAAYYRWLERRGGRKKSGSWEDIRDEIMARARKTDEERRLLEGRDGMKTEVQAGVGTLNEAGSKEAEMRQDDRKERGAKEG